MTRVVTRQNGTREVRFKNAKGKDCCLRLGKIPKRDCESIQRHIKHIVSRQIANAEIDPIVSQWLAGVTDKLHAKLVKHELAAQRIAEETPVVWTLGPWIEKYITESGVKGSTKEQLGSAGQTLSCFFGRDRALNTITISDAANYRIWMETKGDLRSKELKGLALNTVRKKMGRAKQFFKYAIEQGLIDSDPFRKENSTVGSNPANWVFIDAQIVEKIISKIECEDLKIMFAFARFAGMRSHETRIQRWDHIDLVNKRMTVRSYKNHKVGEELVLRECPIFPELLPHLVRAREMAQSGSALVVNKYSHNQNVHQKAIEAVEQAGFEPWVEPWQNLRRSKSTELKAKFPQADITKWIGNTEAVAIKHYFMPLESNFQAATTEPSKISSTDLPEKAHQKAHHTLHDKYSQEVLPEMGGPQNAGKEWQGVLTTLCDFLESDPYGTRTRVTAVKGRCPRPLDEGAV